MQEENFTCRFGRASCRGDACNHLPLREFEMGENVPNDAASDDIPPESIVAIDAAFAAFDEHLLPHLKLYGPGEHRARVRMGDVSEPFVGKVADYVETHPEFMPSYVDKPAFQRAVRRLGTRTTGTMDWFGTAGGEPLPEGLHTLRLVARDLAGNLGPRSGSRTVRIRFLALGRDRIVTEPGERLAILAISQARRLRWSLGARSGVAPPGTLRLRAPDKPGRYVLRVDANGHVRRAVVVVRAAPR